MAEQETHPVVVEEQPTEILTEQSNNDDSTVRTVFHDPKNYNVKHPLQNIWTLWFDNPPKKANVASWSQNLKEIVNVDTVEDFWGVYNNIVKVINLETNSNYHIFKMGVRPEWEDAANADGGKFSIQFPKIRTGEAINDHWLNLMLAMLGEQFKYEDEICGAVVSVRRVFYRIALWTKSSKRNEKIETIGHQLRELLNLNNTFAIEFTSHSDSAVKSDENKFIV